MLATPMAVVMTAPGQNRIRLIVCLVTVHLGGSFFQNVASNANGGLERHSDTVI